MNTLEQARNTQLKNIQTKTGKSLEELGKIIDQSGLKKHGEVLNMLKRDLGMSHGDANAIVLYWFKSDGERAAQAKGATIQDVVNELYSGPKARLRPIHDRLMEAIQNWGEFEILPKKGYVSLRRKKQFAMIGPATNTRVELGLNVTGLPSSSRLIAMPAGSMCNYKIKLQDSAGVDDELIAWIRQAFDRSA